MDTHCNGPHCSLRSISMSNLTTHRLQHMSILTIFYFQGWHGYAPYWKLKDSMMPSPFLLTDSQRPCILSHATHPALHKTLLICSSRTLSICMDFQPWLSLTVILNSALSSSPVYSPNLALDSICWQPIINRQMAIRIHYPNIRTVFMGLYQ